MRKEIFWKKEVDYGEVSVCSRAAQRNVIAGVGSSIASCRIIATLLQFMLRCQALLWAARSPEGFTSSSSFATKFANGETSVNRAFFLLVFPLDL